MLLHKTLTVLFIITENNYRVTNKLHTLANPSIYKHQRNTENLESIRRQQLSYQNQNIACYECSSFPPEEGSLDEILGSCPGWKRSAKRYGVGGSDNTIGSSLYDGCMTIILSNGSVISQNAVVLSQCLEYKTGTLSSSIFDIFGIPSKIYCCKGSLCNGPSEIRTTIIKGLGITNFKVLLLELSKEIFSILIYYNSIILFFLIILIFMISSYCIFYYLFYLETYLSQEKK